MHARAGTYNAQITHNNLALKHLIITYLFENLCLVWGMILKQTLKKLREKNVNFICNKRLFVLLRWLYCKEVTFNNTAHKHINNVAENIL
jgi:hypothetical protein